VKIIKDLIDCAHREDNSEGSIDIKTRIEGPIFGEIKKNTRLLKL